MNDDFLDFLDCDYQEEEDFSLSLDSSFLISSLLEGSQVYDKPVSKEPQPFSFPRYIPFTLLESVIISEEEVYSILYKKNKEVEKESEEDESKSEEDDDKENNCNITHSIYLKPSPLPLKSTTDSKYLINIKNMDSRTTCMIKNIPNKYTQKMLINLLNEHHFGCFDFVYLRMDFKNKCNVGYAFVNFTKTEYIISFYKKINNKGWKLFSSTKIAELTYASIQGFDNLVNKFRNSVVMKEQESFRPKIFYREGRLKGQEDPNFN